MIILLIACESVDKNDSFVCSYTLPTCRHTHTNIHTDLWNTSSCSVEGNSTVGFSLESRRLLVLEHGMNYNVSNMESAAEEAVNLVTRIHPTRSTLQMKKDLTIRAVCVNVLWPPFVTEEKVFLGYCVQKNDMSRQKSQNTLVEMRNRGPASHSKNDRLVQRPDEQSVETNGAHASGCPSNICEYTDSACIVPSGNTLTTCTNWQQRSSKCFTHMYVLIVFVQ